MKEVSKDITVVGVTSILMIVLLLFWTCHIALAQSDISFTLADKFDVPAFKGIITFAANGTYTRASLVNDTWNFENLRLDNSRPLDSLKVSAHNSNITIMSYIAFNTTFWGARLWYVVEGQGQQSFNIGRPPTDGEWSAVFDGVFMGEGDGWTASPDATLTITGATSNVSIWYFGFPYSFMVNENSDQPFYQQHSVAIATAFALAITVTLTIVIRRRIQKNLEKTYW